MSTLSVFSAGLSTDHLVSLSLSNPLNTPFPPCEVLFFSFLTYWASIVISGIKRHYCRFWEAHQQKHTGISQDCIVWTVVSWRTLYKVGDCCVTVLGRHEQTSTPPREPTTNQSKDITKSNLVNQWGSWLLVCYLYGWGVTYSTGNDSEDSCITKAHPGMGNLEHTMQRGSQLIRL